ncbi:MAG: NADPH-dependent 2,4-dienoyl-CoA reductase [Saprospiraceae bacterium]
MKFKNLFTPLDIGATILPNRFLMGSMHTNLEEVKNGFERASVYYAERAKNGVGLIVTGGISPNEAGWVGPHSAKLTNYDEVKKHQLISKAVHDVGGKICMQILHSGRYGYHKNVVGPSAIQSPISFFIPKELSGTEVESTIEDFAQCAFLAQESGYDGIEIMGSEGYLINQFLVGRTNQRSDEWGGSYEKRKRFPLAIIEAIKKRVNPNFIIIYRLSMLDLVEGGSSWREVVSLAKDVEQLNVHLINTGIGWHEARIPTIASSVPRMGFAWVTGEMKKELKVPLIAVNRINTPQIAENIISRGFADMVSMARPFLADPAFVKKAQEGKDHLINTCIACNQACLDHTFQLKISSCLVNPVACHETELIIKPAEKIKKVAVLGGGPSGLAFALVAAQRGHKVTLFEASPSLGGQFNLAKVVPGKEEYAETIRYFTNALKEHHVKIVLNCRINPNDNLLLDYETIAMATGVYPRIPKIKGIHHKLVVRYDELLSGQKPAGKRVAILGGGGIGFDVAEYLLMQTNPDLKAQTQIFFKEWGIDNKLEKVGGVKLPQVDSPERFVYMLKRSPGKFGNTLGKTTGWIKKMSLAKKKAMMISSVTYHEITEEGIWIVVENNKHLLAVDTIVLCTGQVANQDLYQKLQTSGKEVLLVGGAFEASELDAKKAIDQAFRLASQI